jgi:hypothetical protein
MTCNHGKMPSNMGQLHGSWCKQPLSTPKKVSGCTLSWMSCKEIVLILVLLPLFVFFNFLFFFVFFICSASFSLFDFFLFLCFHPFIFFPSRMTFAYLEGRDEWVEEEKEVWHEGDLVFVFFFSWPYVCLSIAMTTARKIASRIGLDNSSSLETPSHWTLWYQNCNIIVLSILYWSQFPV